MSGGGAKAEIDRAGCKARTAPALAGGRRDSIRNGEPIVELKATADSSMTAALGRMAAYTGQKVAWDFATQESKLDLFPKDFDINGPRPEPEFAIPGKTKLI